MATSDCDYSRPGVAPWWSCCTEDSHGPDDRQTGGDATSG